MTVTVKQAKDQRDEAHSKARSLGERATDLVRRLRGGDTSISASDLTAAEQEARHAGLVAQSFDGAVRKAELAEQQRRLDTALQTLSDADAAWQGAAAEHLQPVVDHLAEVLAAAKQRNVTGGAAAGTVNHIPVADVTLPAGVNTSVSSVNGEPVELCAVGEGGHRVDDLIGEILVAAYLKAGLLDGGGVQRLHWSEQGRVHDLVHTYANSTPKYLLADAGQ